MNNSSLVGLLSETKTYQQHRRKIENIMSKSNRSLSFRKNDAFSNFYSSRDISRGYSLRKKQENMEKQNELILKKIISVNKRNQFKTLQQPTNFISHNNLSNLRKKISKTNQQNQILACKLVSTTSKLSQQALISEIKKYDEIKQRIKKYTYQSETGMVIPKKVKSLVKIKMLGTLVDYRRSRIQNEELY